MSKPLPWLSSSIHAQRLQHGLIIPRFVCADGFSLSIQASAAHYCEPRNDTGPWTSFEVVFISQFEEDLMPYAEDLDKPTKTVFARVPGALLESLIAKHGGLASVKDGFIDWYLACYEEDSP